MTSRLAASPPGAAGRVPAWLLAVVAMLIVQLGAALSVGLFPVIGPLGTAWLRLVAGAAILLLWARPRRSDIPRDAVVPMLVLGTITGVMTGAFLVAIDRLPLGTAVAIEFLGPLTVAAIRAHDRRMLVWPLLAFAGIVMLTEPWQGEVDALGLAAALVAAVCWGSYILLTQKVGDRVAGVKGLAISITVAAVVTIPVGVPAVIGGLTWWVLLAAAGLALLMPVLPLSLEMMALRRLTATAFGTLMALEPGIAVVIGPNLLQGLGVVLVVIAGVGAARTGSRWIPEDVPKPRRGRHRRPATGAGR